MEKIISIITEDGVAMLKQIGIANIQEEMNSLLLIRTQDDKEHLGVFITYDNHWDSINLRAAHSEVIIYIKIEKIKEIYKKIQ